MGERRRRGPLLLAGLGNPGEPYIGTRHNIGYAFVERFADEYGWSFKKNLGLKGKLASGQLGETIVHLLKPTTFMNNSGVAIASAMAYFKVSREALLVIADDIYLPFGKCRLREKGSAGGHNGLKSVEAHLLTQDYSRLRIGIGEPGFERLEEYVLSPFTKEECSHLPEVLTKAKELADLWVAGEKIKTSSS